jgi:hypothetical protein
MASRAYEKLSLTEHDREMHDEEDEVHEVALSLED